MTYKRDGVNWEHDETLLAMELYFRVPYGSIHVRNPQIIKLANLLQRKPGAVVYKMGNLASLDPELRASGRKGLENGSKMDKSVFAEYYGRWNELAIAAEIIRKHLESQKAYYDSPNLSNIVCPEGKEVESKTKARIGQDFFHNAVCSEYNNRCCITGIDNARLLQAAHIKPWKDSSPIEKTAPDNGLCLNPLHHKLFDDGMFTLDENYRVLFSPEMEYQKMDEKTKDWLFSYKDKQIEMPDRYSPKLEYISYHREAVFKKN